MSWSTIVDKIYVITTSDKPERLREFIKDIPFDHNLLKVHTMIKKETFSENYENANYPNKDCEHAHTMVAKDALKNGYNKILVFEDDARYSKKMTKELEKKILNWIQNNNWDIVYLGHVLAAPALIVNDHIIQTLGSLQTHAMCYNRKIMNLLVNVKYGAEFDYFMIRDHSKKYFTIDNFLRIEAPYIKAYATKPNMFYQNNFSKPKREIRENFGVYPNEPVDEWDDKVNDTLLFLTVFFIFIIPMIIIVVIISLCNKSM